MPFSGARLRELREGAGLDRKQLAALVGTTAQYVSHLENGVKTNPGYDLVEKLAAALSTDCRAFGGEPEPVKPARPRKVQEPAPTKKGRKKTT